MSRFDIVESSVPRFHAEEMWIGKFGELGSPVWISVGAWKCFSIWRSVRVATIANLEEKMLRALNILDFLFMKNRMKSPRG